MKRRKFLWLLSLCSTIPLVNKFTFKPDPPPYKPEVRVYPEGIEFPTIQEAIAFINKGRILGKR